MKKKKKRKKEKQNDGEKEQLNRCLEYFKWHSTQLT